MRAITLHQPWASLMANEAKKEETRNSVTKFRGEVAICAALKWTRELKDIATSEPFASALFGRPINQIQDLWEIVSKTPLGVVVSVGELYDSITSDEWMALFTMAEHADMNSAAYRERHFGCYAKGRGVWRFRNMRKLAKPVPVIGRQFWFSLTPEQEAAVRAQL